MGLTSNDGGIDTQITKTHPNTTAPHNWDSNQQPCGPVLLDHYSVNKDPPPVQPLVPGGI